MFTSSYAGIEPTLVGLANCLFLLMFLRTVRLSASALLTARNHRSLLFNTTPCNCSWFVRDIRLDNPLLLLANVAAQRDEKRNDYAHFQNRQELMNILHVSLLREKVNEIGDLEQFHLTLL
jgi:hypothetical protein